MSQTTTTLKSDLRRDRRKQRAARLQNNIGHNVRLLRASSGESQLTLANRVDITQSEWSRMEAGRYLPGIDVLLAVAGAFDVQVDDLLTEPVELR